MTTNYFGFRTPTVKEQANYEAVEALVADLDDDVFNDIVEAVSQYVCYGFGTPEAKTLREKVTPFAKALGVTVKMLADWYCVVE